MESNNEELYADLPSEIVESLEAYAKDRRPTGGFLRACLENNLMEAAGRADCVNQKLLYEICNFIYNEIPSVSHGSPELVEKWLAGSKSD